MSQPIANQKQLAAQLSNLAKRILDGYDPANGTDANNRTFERTGYLAIRAGILMITEGDHAHRLAADWSARGYPAATNSEPGRATTIDTDGDVTLTSVEAAGLSSDHWERTVAMLDHERRSIDDDTRSIESRIASTIRVIPPEQRRTKLLTDTALDLDCANPNCDNKITRMGDDRPRRGRCPRCYKFLTRNNRDWTERTQPCPHPETAGR